MLRVFVEAWLLTLGLGMPLELYLITWAATGRGGEPYRLAFEAFYHLEIGTIDEGGPPVDAMVVVPGYESFWVEIGFWIFDPRAACLAGCPQSQRPV